MWFLNLLSYIGVGVGALLFSSGLIGSPSAPQQAAIAAMALVVAFLPYAVARIAGSAVDRKLLRELVAASKREVE